MSAPASLWHGPASTAANRLRTLATALLLVALLPLALAPPAAAQGRTADIVGVSSDSTGARLPGVTVTARNLATNQQRVAVTDGEGNYLITLLPPGRYSVQAELAGFSTWTIPDVTLAAGDRVALDPVLSVGAASETVRVIADSPALQTQTATLSSLVDSRAMQDLPLNGRNFVVLAQLIPGANDSTIGYGGGNTIDDRRMTSQVTVNGQYAWANNFMIDGMDNNERFIGTMISKPSVEAIQEMRIQTNVYSAELGRTAGGAINIITRSGTNDLRGAGYGYFRNEHLDARDFFALAKSPYRQQQFGGSLGGPIRKNRTFFFADYEGLRVEQGLTFTATVPTMAMREGNFAGVARVFDPLTTVCSGTTCVRQEFTGGRIPADRIDAVGRRLVNLYPEPTRDGLANNFTYSPSRTLDQDSVDLRLDHRLSDVTSLFGRYSYGNTRSLYPPAIPIGDGSFSGGTSDLITHGAQVNLLRTIGPRTIAELRGGFSQYNIESVSYNAGRNVADEVGIPNVNVSFKTSGLSIINPAGYQVMGDGSFTPQFNTNNVFQVGGSLTHQRGAHAIKIGAEFRKRDVNEAQSASARGTFAFNQTLTVDNPLNPTSGAGNSIASLLLGYPFTVSRQLQLIDPRYRFVETGAFIQDDWRVRRWLTLNLGLRYDYYSPLTEADDNLSNVDIEAGRIVIAGQDGVSRSANVQKDWINLAPRFGFAATVTERTVVRGGYGISFVPPFMGSPNAMRNPPFVSLYNTSPASTVPVARVADGFPVPAPASVTDPVGALVAVGFENTIPYVHQFNVTAQHQLLGDLVVGATYVGQRGKGQFPGEGAINVNAPPPGDPRTVTQRRPYAAVLPNVSNIGVSSGWSETRYDALQLTVERRFRAGLGLSANYVLAHATDTFEQRLTDTGREFPWADSNLDVRHRFTMTANYELPFAADATGLLGLVAKGWQVNLIGQAQTSTPFSIVNTGDINGTGGALQDRPNLAGDPELASSERSIRRWFNTAAFERQPVGTYGDVIRNSMRGPNMVTFDASASKTFRPGQRAAVQFIVQVFNVLNHTNLGPPNGTLGSAAFGTISRTVGTPRQMQLALKVTF